MATKKKTAAKAPAKAKKATKKAAVQQAPLKVSDMNQAQLEQYRVELEKKKEELEQNLMDVGDREYDLEEAANSPDTPENRALAKEWNKVVDEIESKFGAERKVVLPFTLSISYDLNREYLAGEEHLEYCLEHNISCTPDKKLSTYLQTTLQEFVENALRDTCEEIREFDAEYRKLLDTLQVKVSAVLNKNKSDFSMQDILDGVSE